MIVVIVVIVVIVMIVVIVVIVVIVMIVVIVVIVLIIVILVCRIKLSHQSFIAKAKNGVCIFFGSSWGQCYENYNICR